MSAYVVEWSGGRVVVRHLAQARLEWYQAVVDLILSLGKG